MELQYLIARENLHKRLQTAFFHKREELERQRKLAPEGPEVTAWKSESKKGTADQIMVVTMSKSTYFC